MSDTSLPKYEALITDVERQLAHIHRQLALLQQEMAVSTNDGILIAVRSAVRGVNTKIRETQAECHYLRDTLTINGISIDEVVANAKAVQG